MKDYRKWSFGIIWICTGILGVMYLADTLMSTNVQNHFSVREGKEHAMALILIFPGLIFGLYNFFTRPENSGKEILYLICRIGLIFGVFFGLMIYTKATIEFALVMFLISFVPPFLFGVINAAVIYSGQKIFNDSTEEQYST